MKEYEEYKAKHFSDAATIANANTRSTVDLLKFNAVLVEEIAGHKSLAEDIFANALEIEETLKKLVG